MPRRRRRVQVFGPAYLDRVLRVDGPCSTRRSVPPGSERRRPLGVRARAHDCVDPAGDVDRRRAPRRLAGPDRRGHALAAPPGSSDRGVLAAESVRGVSWHDDLGGMGAGFAAAPRGRAGRRPRARGRPDQPGRRRTPGAGRDRPPADPGRRTIPPTGRCSSPAAGIGDKLPIGFRGCHAALRRRLPDAGARRRATSASWRRCRTGWRPRPCAGRARPSGSSPRRCGTCSTGSSRCRGSPRRSTSSAATVSEWESLADREEVAWRVSILAITDGPRGSARPVHDARRARPGSSTVPAFPRTHPPRDTNRAGEAFAATLVTTPPRRRLGPRASPSRNWSERRPDGPRPPPPSCSTGPTSASPPPPRSMPPSSRGGSIDGAPKGSG